MLIHHFGVVKIANKDYADRRQWKHFTGLKELMLRRIEVPDDVILYIADSLEWIPTFNPSTQKEQSGITYHGITIIPSSGAKAAASIFGAWASLLSLSPEVLRLTAWFSLPKGETNQGGYEGLHLRRDDVTSSLNAIVSACERVSESGGAEYLLHLGI